MFRTSMRMRPVVLWLPLFAGLTLGSATPVHSATTNLAQRESSLQPQVAAEVADLKQQLEKGLRVQRPEDFEFIDQVVRMVGNDTLPLDLVKSTFLWARKKAISTRYLFPYFERALRLRAAKQGIKIP